jgi:hypothetical protein
MRALTRLAPAALAFAVTLGLACKDSNAPRAIPQTIAKLAGDTQLALTGTPLDDSLVVRVMGSGGSPFAGAVVTWAVTSGSATLGAPSGTTDSQGRAFTTVTVGGTSGPVAVQASVTSLTPVTFTATVCDHPGIVLGDTVAGVLATSDCRINGYYTDFFELPAATGPQGVRLTMTGAFDTWLEMYRTAGFVALNDPAGFLAVNDDIDSTTTNSQIDAIVPADAYRVEPSSFALFTTGAYTLSAVPRQPELAGCGLVWTTRGVVISDSVTTTDCVDSTGGVQHYADIVAMYLEAGTVLKVSHHSAAFDAALFLHNGAGASVATNNDSAGGTTNAYIQYPVALSGGYLLFVATNAASATGPYTLTISSSTTLSGSSPVQREGPQVLRVAPLRMPKGRLQRLWSPAARRTM